jgi:DNA-binding MarR family transcriptional regulator
MDEMSLMDALLRAKRRAEAAYARGCGMTRAEFWLVGLARRRGRVSLSEAAAELGWDRPSCTLVARRCVKAGWLLRTRSESDRRSSLLALTGEGEELLDRIEARRLSGANPAADPLAALGEAERLELRRLLEKAASSSPQSC